LSLGGCRIAAERRYASGILVRGDVQFQLPGIDFRIERSFRRQQRGPGVLRFSS
jgi:hypothetical protein